RHHRAKRQFL
ncbi:hypothetical protein D021_3226B, partial [Vibrio parahaemolyticus 10296]